LYNKAVQKTKKGYVEEDSKYGADLIFSHDYPATFSAAEKITMPPEIACKGAAAS